MKIVEKLDKDFNFVECLPTEDDFKKFIVRFNEYLQKGDDADLINTPSGLASSIRNPYKKFRYLLMAIIFERFVLKSKKTEWADAIAHSLLLDGYTKDEIKKVLSSGLEQKYRYIALLNKYIPMIRVPHNTTENLTEASNLTPEQKMDMWHNGTRRLNITACSDAKLEMYFNICENANYYVEADLLRQEGKRRGLWWATTIDFTNCVIQESDPDLDPSTVFFVKKNSSEAIIRDLDSITPRTGLTEHSYKTSIIYLILAICLKDNNLANLIKEWLHNHSVDKDTLKAQLTNSIHSQKLVNRISEIIKVAMQENPSLFNQKLKEELEEDIEKHDVLNPKLWNEDNTLKPEVEEKINQIVDEFLNLLEEDDVKIKIKDIILIGSNCSYNYTKDSDLDIHIVADTKSLKCPDNLYSVLYSAYRSIFNKKFEINFYGIPVEIYVETEGVPRVTNGCYSVKNKKWIKEPDIDAIPEFDEEKVNEEFKEWEDKYTEFLNELNDSTVEEVEDNINKIKSFIDELYNLRRQGLSDSGEYGVGNLLFKEFRNRGYLDNLKVLKDELIGKNLSLVDKELVDKEKNEEDNLLGDDIILAEQLSSKDIDNYRNMIFKICPIQPIIQENGIFYIYGIKENEVNTILNKLRTLPGVQYATESAGKIDYTQPTIHGIKYKYKYNIHGVINPKEIK